jgi:hypothetical protein
MGERGAEEAKRSSVFSAHYAYSGVWHKRLEIEYHESIPVENLKSISPSLRPDACLPRRGPSTHQLPVADRTRHPQFSGVCQIVPSST